jgi:Spy/CpxP family protein refolding chaperone
MTATVKRLAIALALSLAVNLFLAGFFTMRALHGRRHHPRGHHGHFMGPRGMAGGDPAIKQAMRRVMQRRDGDFRAHKQRLHDARAGVSAAFGAEPFDGAALGRALAGLRAQTAESQRLMHEALIEVAPQLTAEQRSRLARRALDREPGGRPGGPR